MAAAVREDAAEIVIDLEQDDQHARRLNQLKRVGLMEGSRRPRGLAKAVRIVAIGVVLENLRAVRCEGNRATEWLG